MPLTRPIQPVPWIAIALIAMAGLIVPFLWWDHPEIRLFMRTWREGRTDEFTRNWKQLDLRLADAAGSGNLVLRFVGFNPETPGHVRIVQEASWRGAYALYPKRVFVAEPGTVVNNAGDILATPFDPSVEWLQDHDVRVVLTIVATGEESFVQRPQRVPPRGGR